MSTQAEAKYRAAKERLAGSPDDLAALKEFSEAARAFGRRPEALDALKAAYSKRATQELYAELRMVCTFPEFQAIPKPPESGAAPANAPGSGAELLPRKAFPLLLDQVVFYPVQDGQSIFILVTCAIMMTIGSMFAWAMAGVGVAGALLCYGIVFGYLWTVLHASGMGEKHTRGWPDLTHPEEFGAAVGQYYMVLFICFGPAIAVLFLRPLGDEFTPNLLASIALGLGGMLYFPMALMLAGFTHNSWEALNLPSGLRSIFKMPGDYLICLGFMLFAGILITVGQVMLGTTFGAAPFPLRVAISLVGQTLSVYLMIVQMRTVGLLYYAREKDLGWFQ